MNNYYKSGTWNIICDLCGKKCKSDEVRKRWDGLIVCAADYETRQLLDLIRPYPPERPVPFIRDEPADTLLYTCYLVFSQSIADIAQADCARADYILPPALASTL